MDAHPYIHNRLWRSSKLNGHIGNRIFFLAFSKSKWLSGSVSKSMLFKPKDCGLLRFFQVDDLGGIRFLLSGAFDLAQQVRGDVPPVTVTGGDGKSG